ncbi:MAG: hypothetical protein ABI647_24440 [Gemmatimonadota bacterium]
MRKPILLYGLLGGALIALLKAIEYRYLVVEHSVEIYGALVALVFVTLGIWLGLRITGRQERVIMRLVRRRRQRAVLLSSWSPATAAAVPLHPGSPSVPCPCYR